MFDNIGGKLKGVAVLSTILGIIGSILLGIVVFATFGELWYYGLFIIIVGCLGYWISSLGMYGIGQVVENTEKLLDLKNETSKPKKTEIEDIEDNLPQL